MTKYLPSLSTKLNRYILLSFAVVYMIALLNLTLVSFEMIKKDSIKNASATVEYMVNDLERVLSEVSVPVENMAWIVKEHLDDPDYMYKITSQLVTSNPLIMGSTVAFAGNYFPGKGKYFAPYSCIDDEMGHLMSFQMGGEDYDYFKMEWYSRPSSTARPCWSEPYFDDGGGDRLMSTYSYPVRDDSGRVIAIITSDVSLKDLTDRMNSGDNTYNFLISGKGRFLAHPDSVMVHDKTIFEFASMYDSHQMRRIADNMLAGRDGAEFVNLAGDTYIVAYGPLENGWSAGLICTRAEIFEDLLPIRKTAVWMILLGILAVGGAGRRIIRRQTQPITQFAYTAQSIAKGNFHASIPEIDSVEELDHLRQSFVYLEDSINTYISQLKSATGVKEKLESELNIARDIQLGMVPKIFPSNESFDLKASMRAAKEVGGDLFDYVLRDGKLLFAVGDVSGKGVPAALFMATAKSTFHLVAKSSDDPAHIVSVVNNVFAEDNECAMFATFFVACIDLKTLRMDFCNGGHNPIVVISPEGKAGYLAAKPNIAVGLFENFPYVGESMTLIAGSRILVYTDGVTEAEARDKSQYGEPRLLEYCSSVPTGASSSEFIDGLMASLSEFTAGNAQNDDITVLTIHL